MSIEPATPLAKEMPSLTASKWKSLGSSARASLMWSGGFTLLRDLAQFAVMLILVRLIGPSDYGTVALAQSIVGFISVASFGVLITHALQLRDPAQVDWQAHFTAGLIVNSALFVVTLVVAHILSRVPHYQASALPLAVLALTFLLDIPATLRHRMVQVEHDWMRFRALLMIGTLLSLAMAVLIALAGGSFWALVVQPLLFGLPATIDLFWNTKWKPDWSWSWARYRDTVRFTTSRVAVGVLSTGRAMTEQATMATAYDFVALGVFSRAVGLATMAAGRIGMVAPAAIYPILTRAEQGSAQFRRYASLVLTGVCWTTIGAAVFIALASSDLVALLYGPTWTEAAPLLPLAAVSIGANGILAAITNLLLANNEVRACLWVDLATTSSGIAIALWLIPVGAATYLAGLTALNLGLVLLALAVLRSRSTIDAAGVTKAFVPGLVAGSMAAMAVLGLRQTVGISPYLVVRLTVDGLVVALTYGLTLRIAFAGPLAELADVIPGGRRLARSLLLHRRRSGPG
jgi:O-antigen/teichoic acid export membrane protein